MHSKSFFILQTLLAAVGALILLMGALFLLSYLLFMIPASNISTLSSFGWRGALSFILLFPWIWFGLALAILFILELVVRHTTETYHFSLLRVFAWLAAISIVGSALVELTPLHHSLLLQADRNQLPLIGPLYEAIHDSHQAQGIYRGTVSTLTNDGFVISHNDTDRDSDDGTWTIIAPADFDRTSVVVGNKAYVAGDLHNGLVYAYGIRILPKDD